MDKKKRKNQEKCKRIAAVCLSITLVAGNFTAQPVTTQAATNKVTAIQLNTTAKKLCIGEKFTLKVSKRLHHQRLLKPLHGKLPIRIL